MLWKLFKKLPWNPLGGGSFINGILHKGIIQASPPAFLLASLVHGIELRPRGDGICLAKGYGGEMLITVGNWQDFLEIWRDEIYERVFRVEKGEVVIDVGAHVGMFTLKASKKCGRDGLVVAIEPEPKNMNLLSENVKKYSLKNIVLVQKAVGNSEGKAKLYLSRDPVKHSLIRRNQTEYIEVHMGTLDRITSSLKIEKADFIKIDAEGTELEVLRGAKRLLKQPNVKLAISAYHVLPDGNPEFPQILSYLKSKGMEVWAKDYAYIYAKTS